jgi:sugar (glycoside-pentoside-hexuronide) transporter
VNKTQSKTETEEKFVSKKERIALYLSGGNSYITASFVSTYLIFFYTDIFIIPMAAINILMIAARVWDAINDTFMGAIIDRTRTKYGRMRPYLRYGAVAMAISVAILFAPFSMMPTSVKVVYACVTYIAFGMLYTLVDIPLWGLLSVATPNKKERAGLLSATATIGSIGAILPMLIIPPLSDALGGTVTYFGFALLLGALTFITMSRTSRVTTERIEPPKEKYTFIENFQNALKSRPMMMTLLSSILACPRYLMMLAAIYISTYVIEPFYIGSIHMTSGLILMLLYVIVGAGMLLGMLLTQPLFKIIGYKFAMMFGGAVGAVALIITYALWNGNNLWTIAPFLVMGGFALGLYNVIPFPMVGDSLDYLEWKTGNRGEGFCFSLQSFTSKFNQAFAAIALTTGLMLIGFIQPKEAGVPLPQEESTLHGMFAFVSLLPGIGFALSIIPLFFYNYNGKLRKQVTDELAERRKNAPKEWEDEDYIERPTEFNDIY